MYRGFGLVFPIDRCVDDQKHSLIRKVISENWQEKLKYSYVVMR